MSLPPSKRRRTDGGVRVKGPRPEELTFDFAQRQEYLTGFHKRKQARIKHAQELAAKREREEKIRDRKELRQKRKEELEEHVKAVSAALNIGADTEDDDERDPDLDWEGIPDHEDVSETVSISAPAVQPVDREDEYVDEEKFTTVTIEEVGISKHGFDTADGSADESEDSGVVAGQAGAASGQSSATHTKKGWMPRNRQEEREGRTKKKRKKFKYESKGERKITKARERMKNSKVAKARKGK